MGIAALMVRCSEAFEYLLSSCRLSFENSLRPSAEVQAEAFLWLVIYTSSELEQMTRAPSGEPLTKRKLTASDVKPWMLSKLLYSQFR
jgi:hypothetical protein